MTRRHLDIILATGGAVFALLILGLGLVAFNQANYAKDYVKTELSAQKITFTPADKLDNETKSWKSGSSCLVENGGKLLETGAQAECYANYYIALHLDQAATKAGYPGATYATIGDVQTDLRNQIAAAKQANDPKAADLQKQLDSVTALRETQFKGESLRGMLLTSYGFSIFGERAALAAYILIGIAAVAAIVSVAGFIHAFMTPKDQRVFGGQFSPAPTR